MVITKSLKHLTLLAAIWLALSPLTVLAQDAGPTLLDLRYAEAGLWAAPDAEDAGSCDATGLLGDITLPPDLQDEWKEILPKAANEHQIDLATLMTVLWVENRAYPDPNRTDWAVSNGGAKGPFQFIDSSWNAYKQDGNGDGVMDVNNSWDAAYAAAALIAGNRGFNGLALGSLEDDFSTAPAFKDEADLTIADQMISYNAGAGTYLNGGTWGYKSGGNFKAWGSAKQDEIWHYIELGLQTYTSLRGGNPDAIANPTKYEGPACSGGLGFAGDLYFPMIITQSVIREGIDSSGNPGGGIIWCYQNTSNCHGSYNAADIHAPVGTPIVAAVGGTVKSINTSKTSQLGSCTAVRAYITIYGDDGNTYFYQHMTPGSNEHIGADDTIAAGDVIGTVGDVSAADCTPPHLHFDAHPTGSVADTQGVNRNCADSGACAAAANEKIDMQEALHNAYLALPD